MDNFVMPDSCACNANWMRRIRCDRSSIRFRPILSSNFSEIAVSEHGARTRKSGALLGRPGRLPGSSNPAPDCTVKPDELPWHKIGWPDARAIEIANRTSATRDDVHSNQNGPDLTLLGFLQSRLSRLQSCAASVDVQWAGHIYRGASTDRDTVSAQRFGGGGGLLAATSKGGFDAVFFFRRNRGERKCYRGSSCKHVIGTRVLSSVEFVTPDRGAQWASALIGELGEPHSIDDRPAVSEMVEIRLGVFSQVNHPAARYATWRFEDRIVGLKWERDTGKATLRVSPMRS